MKKIKIDKKLSLNKETIARLSNQQMNEIKGGIVGNGTDPVTITACPTGLVCQPETFDGSCLSMVMC